jgi:uncharacterized protein
MPQDQPYMRPSTPRNSREVRVGKSATGLGLYARRWYREDMVVGEIEGEVVADPNYGSEYCFDLEDGSYLEPVAPFRFLNHSCEANCEFEVFDLSEHAKQPTRRRLMLMALTDIRPGEELTIDYNWPLEGAIVCKCGAEKCRGWVVAAAELAAVVAMKAAAL